MPALRPRCEQADVPLRYLPYRQPIHVQPPAFSAIRHVPGSAADPRSPATSSAGSPDRAIFL
jgi:hypothetical protein